MNRHSSVIGGVCLIIAALVPNAPAAPSGSADLPAPAPPGLVRQIKVLPEQVKGQTAAWLKVTFKEALKALKIQAIVPSSLIKRSW